MSMLKIENIAHNQILIATSETVLLSTYLEAQICGTINTDSDNQ